MLKYEIEDKKVKMIYLRLISEYINKSSISFKKKG